jgi:hypothetical protein
MVRSCAWGCSRPCGCTCVRRPAGQAGHSSESENYHRGAERSHILLSHRKHGRRRAVPALPSIRGRRRASVVPEPPLRSHGKQFGVAAVVTGLIAMTALSAASADPSWLTAAQERPPASKPSAAPGPPVTAAAASDVAFARPEVSSKPAPQAPPPRPAVTAAAASDVVFARPEVSSKPAPQAPATTVPVPDTSQAPITTSPDAGQAAPPKGRHRAPRGQADHTADKESMP